MQQVIYFLQLTDKGPIKIGFTQNIERRLKQAQTFNPEEIRLLGTMPGHQRLETELIHRFSSYHIRGEWFSYNDELYNLAKGIYAGEYITENDRHYVILYRDTQRSATDPCSFCCFQHNHGLGDGHRVGHCPSKIGRETITLPSGQKLHRKHGYIIKTRNLNSTERPEEPIKRAVNKTRLSVFSNLLAFAVNQFIDMNIFTLETSTKPPEGGTTLLVNYPDGTPCKIRCYDAGYDEVGIQVLYGIKAADPPIYTFVSRDSRSLCSAHASGWLERRSGQYLQIPENSTSIELYCEKDVLQQIAQVPISPINNSFGMRGPFHF
ncbi:GIY-YIG nuclease family protein [Desulfocicer niacini]